MSMNFLPDQCKIASSGPTTHLLQPLDKGIFSPLKSQWKKVVQSYTAKQSKVITRYEFSALFKMRSTVP